MAVYGARLIQQVTFVLGRHDPAGIFECNPDAPPDEYEREAEQILGDFSVLPRSQEEVLGVVTRVFKEGFDGGVLNGDAMHRAARDIYRVFDS